MAMFAMAFPILPGKTEGWKRFTDEFTTWFKQQAMDAHGVDLDAPPPGPLPELVLDSGAA